MVTKEAPESKKHRTSWQMEENYSRLKQGFVNIRYIAVRGQCDEACLVLGLDPFPKQ